jgi:hypothetical protein
MHIPCVVRAIIMKYKRDMELLVEMERKYEKTCSYVTLYSLQSDLLKKYLHLVTNHFSDDIHTPFNLLDDYYTVQNVLLERLRIWSMPEKIILGDTRWGDLIADFMLYFIETRLFS